MATPLSATGRIVVSWTVAGVIHKCHAYVRGLTNVGGTWQHNSRTTDANDQIWTNSAVALKDAISYVLPTAAYSFNQSRLEQLTSGIWQLVATDSTAGTDHSFLTASSYGNSLTISLRDTAYNMVRVSVQDIGFAGAWHITVLNYWGDGRDTFLKQWTPSYTLTHAPYLWQVGRANLYLAVSPLIAEVVSQNRKIRRAHGAA